METKGQIKRLTGEGAAYVPNGTIHGFRFGRPEDVVPEKTNFDVPGDGTASAYVVADWLFCSEHRSTRSR